MRLVWGICSILIGLVFILYPQIEKVALDAEQKALIEAFEGLGTINDAMESTLPQLPQLNDQQQLNYPPQQQEFSHADELALLDGVKGVIRIPKIDAALPIFDGAGEASLRKGVGIIESEKEFGVHNVGLAGHRAIAYGKQFNRLDELMPDDEIEVQTRTHIYQFTVVQSFVVDRTEVGVLADQEEPLITLVTCTPIGVENPTDRLIIQARLSQKTALTP
ncbi:class D sortase [Rubeoparvulum massiliense]|uniref:class D sortase n=1 Tax=Rubeoparvulum massiliense TaxID=1631346 RepID=UPI00065E9AFF|nr:class D sortase [Rubeoparvulum massiliense]